MIAQNNRSIADLFEKGRKGGESYSCANFGNMNANGHGVIKDGYRVIKLYEKGCKGWNAKGTTNLDICIKMAESYFKMNTVQKNIINKVVKREML